MLSALDAPDGKAHGILVGEVADAISKRFNATSPIYIDVSTEKRYAQPGCSRLNVRFWQDGVQLPNYGARRAGTAAADHRLRHQLLPRRPAAAVAVDVRRRP